MKNLVSSVLLSLMFFGSAHAESHITTGVIKQITSDEKTLIISHQEFPGFMDAMTMPFQLNDQALLDGLQAGDEIEFTIEKTETGYPIISIKNLSR